jgi:phosphatidylinositol alpha 1,6-mannosyltransferase
VRIAFFAGTMRPDHDGVTRVLYRYCRGLEQRGHEVACFSPITPRAEEAPAPTYPVPSFAFPFYTDYRVSLPSYRPFLRPLRRFRPDVLHIHTPCPLGFAAVTCGARLGIPTLATYHTHFESYAKFYPIPFITRPGWAYLRWVYGHCRRLLVPSAPILEVLRRRGLTNLHHLPHGVDADRFHPRFRSTSWRAANGLEGRVGVLYAGRLVWEKDLETLAGAYSLLSGREDLVFALAGEGPKRDVLAARMPNARFLGHRTGSALSTVFASADLFVLPSTTETFGNVTLEAMASGIPAICVNEGGAPTNVRDGVTGLIAEPRDPASLARAIERLAGDAGLRERMGWEALRYARRQSWERILDRLVDHYEVVLQADRRVARPLARLTAAT